jgi:hypothetical protein
MKNNNRFYKCLAGFAAALTIITLVCLPSRALAQEKQATQLMKVHTYEDLQKVDVGDTIVMTCPKCKDHLRASRDEPYKRMDGWMDGRRDVDLDGDRRSGGGPAGRRDWQAVQEIIAE